MNEVIEIFGKRLKIVTDESDSALNTTMSALCKLPKPKIDEEITDVEFDND